jgi:type III pantothenate kinase
MKLLLVDAGNARLKWATRDSHGIGAQRVADCAQDSEAALTALREAATDSVDAVAVSNVAGQEMAGSLNRAFAGKPEDFVWYARSTREAAGVRNAYSQPDRLGVDRWAALVGAYARLRSSANSRPLCIVDAGTALTIDALQNDGTHLGGLILPGIRLQRTALLDSTADIALNARAVTDPPEGLAVFATDTASALMRSGPFACAAAIERCVHEISAAAGPPMLLLAGGDADAIAPWLATDFEICPNLVFEGLAILFEQRSLD